MRATMILGAGLTWAVLGACGDPTHDDAVAALGPEASGVEPGPTHRPGQPCLTCHGGSGPGGTTFSIGGTAYETQTVPLADGGAPPPSAPLVGATVQLTDSLNSTHSTPTNSVGNFYIALSDWAPTAPIGGLEQGPDGGAESNHEIQICQGPCNSPTAATVSMVSQIGRDGSCADCHFSPPGPLSAGPLYLMAK
jgi:hypothetical protein